MAVVGDEEVGRVARYLAPGFVPCGALDQDVIAEPDRQHCPDDVPGSGVVVQEDDPGGAVRAREGDEVPGRAGVGAKELEHGVSEFGHGERFPRGFGAQLRSGELLERVMSGYRAGRVWMASGWNSGAEVANSGIIRGDQGAGLCRI